MKISLNTRPRVANQAATLVAFSLASIVLLAAGCGVDGTRGAFGKGVPLLGAKQKPPPPPASEQSDEGYEASETRLTSYEQEIPASRQQGSRELEQEKPMFGHDSTAAKAGIPIEHASDADFAHKVLQAEGPVLVDFHADWCGPCRRLAPVLEDVASEASEGRIVKVNVDDAQSVASQYGVSSIPMLIVFRDGQPVGQHVGLANKQLVKQMLE
jgi:thioredoxin 1